MQYARIQKCTYIINLNKQLTLGNIFAKGNDKTADETAACINEIKNKSKIYS